MGWIDFEGWGVVLDDIELLNQASEVRRLGLVFEQYPGVIYATAKGNVATYYLILSEVKRRLVSGAFNVKVALSSGETKTLVLGSSFAIEDGNDISGLLG